MRRVALCAALGLPAAAMAGGFSGASGGVALVSDKVVRGLSQSGGQPSVLADVVWRDDAGWALSAGAATLGHGQPRGRAEFHAGAGLGGAVGDQASWLAAVTHYVTQGPAATRRPDYDEVLFGLGWQQLGVALTVAPNYVSPASSTSLPSAMTSATPRRGTGLYAELTWHQPLYGLAPQLQGLALDAGVGRAAYGRVAVASFGYGNLGLTWAHGPWQLTATRIFNNSRASSDASGRTLVSVLLNF